MLSQSFETWENNILNEGLNIGKQEGIKIGHRNAVRRLIYSIVKKRLEQLPLNIVNKIESISDARILDEIALEMTDARSPDDFEHIVNKLHE